MLRHETVSSLGPSGHTPPFAGPGALQSRWRVLTPIPQETEHGANRPQLDQLPSRQTTTLADAISEPMEFSATHTYSPVSFNCADGIVNVSEEASSAPSFSHFTVPSSRLATSQLSVIGRPCSTRWESSAELLRTGLGNLSSKKKQEQRQVFWLRFETGYWIEIFRAEF